MAGFPEPQSGVRYLTEGGVETEVMYKHGHDLPEFCAYPLLDNPAAVADLSNMYTSYLEVAATYGFIPLMAGLDYRASADWAALIGVSPEQLKDFQFRSIDFLRDRVRPFADRLPRVLIAGAVGPRGDAYEQNDTITAAEAEDYHSVQLTTLREAKVDLVTALTFSSIPEAIGVARAASGAGLALSMGFIVDSVGCLLTGPTLQEAVETVDAEAGAARPDFYGINCSHPLEFEPALVPGEWLTRLRSLRPNASSKEKIDLCEIGHLESGDPPLLAKQIAALSQRLPAVDVFGGCCGTWDDHLGAIANELVG